MTEMVTSKESSLVLVGKKVPRVDAVGKVTGAIRYVADYNFPGMIYGKTLHSTVPHAKIKKIDVSEALKLDGVVAIITGKDIPFEGMYGYVIPDEEVLARDKVRFWGQGIAVVGAISEEIAEKALKLIKVEYEELPAVFDPEEAMKEGAPQVNIKERNIIAELHTKKGDVERAFKEADIVIEREFRTQRVEHCYLEPDAVVVIPKGKHLDVISNAQYAFFTRQYLAQVLNLPLSCIRLLVPTIGGSFGGKDSSAIWITARAALLALKTGRPVKMVFSREDVMMETTKRHPFIMKYKIAATKDGRIIGLKALNIADGGAFSGTSPFVIFRAHVHSAGPYDIPNVEVDTYAVYTNNPPSGSMRGFGSPQVNIAIDGIIDELAYELGMDPFEVKYKNLIKQGSITMTGQELTGHKVSIRELSEIARKLSNWEEKRKEFEKESGRYKKGIGIANGIRGVSLGGEMPEFATGQVIVNADGSVTIACGLQDPGQGARTVLSQIVAEDLGVSMDVVNYLELDTTITPDPLLTTASRATIMGGNALLNATRQIKDRMAGVAAKLLNTDKEKIVFKNGFVFDKDNPDKKIEFRNLARQCLFSGVNLTAVGVFVAPPLTWDPATGTGTTYFTFAYFTNVAEVTVDTETGEVRVDRVYSIHDSGRIVNPNTARGQVYGGVSFGIGYALFEEFKMKDGVPQQFNFDKYKILSAEQVPEIIVKFVENPDPNGPYGAKSLAEPALDTVACAIMDAIRHAIGKRIYSLPATPDKVLKALRGD